MLVLSEAKLLAENEQLQDERDKAIAVLVRLEEAFDDVRVKHKVEVEELREQLQLLRASIANDESVNQLESFMKPI